MNTTAVAIHALAASLAMLAGITVFFRAKGTRLHCALGYLYTAAMITLCTTGFFIRELSGGWSAFHVMALISLATLAAGLLPVLLRRPHCNWLELHYGFMSGSYLGLLAAGASQLATQLVARPYFWWAVGGATLSICLVGSWLISHLKPRVLAPMQHRFGLDRPEGPTMAGLLATQSE